MGLLLLQIAIACRASTDSGSLAADTTPTLGGWQQNVRIDPWSTYGRAETVALEASSLALIATPNAAASNSLFQQFSPLPDAMVQDAGGTATSGMLFMGAAEVGVERYFLGLQNMFDTSSGQQLAGGASTSAGFDVETTPNVSSALVAPPSIVDSLALDLQSGPAAERSVEPSAPQQGQLAVLVADFVDPLTDLLPTAIASVASLDPYMHAQSLPNS
ncbi:MAG TPA: hypothetical protein VFV57_12490 [Limnobacter sp.]|nr:hypothetical protein [Limnobacter sp.]